MRTFGPGSLSSFLKTALDVAYFAVVGLFILLALAAVLAILSFSFSPSSVIGLLEDATGTLGLAERVNDGAVIPVFAMLALYGLVYLAALAAILLRVRKVFANLTAGDPFHPDNIRHLRLIGPVLAGMEIARYGLRAIMLVVAPEIGEDIGGFSITPWFAVLVVFVLAEVFREGARLRREAELTI